MRRSVLVALIAWLGVVVAGSTMTWATINTAGQEVLSPGAVPTAPENDGGTPSRRDEGTRRPDPRREPTQSPSPRSTPSPARSASPDGPTSSPDPSRRPTPTPTPTPQPTPQPTRSTPTNETPRTAAWRGVAGSVTVLCTGSTISLQAASPNNGYSVEVRERGPEEVEVRLEADEAETRVEAFCSSGRARFDVTT